MNFKSNRSKACDISPKVKMAVGERDNWLCIFCGRPGVPNMHIIPRSQGGLGIEENIACGCMNCHTAFDNGQARELYMTKAVNYMKSKYDYWSKEYVTYNKWDFLKGDLTNEKNNL